MIDEHAQAAYSAAINEEQGMQCKCEHWQQCDGQQASIDQPKPSRHAAMIAEWEASGRTRKVEYKSEVYGQWRPSIHKQWLENIDYRFADEVKPEIVSSLSEEEIETAYVEVLKAIPNTVGDCWRAIANAAAKKAYAEGYQAAIADVCAMPSETSLDDVTLHKYKHREKCAEQAIAQFQADVKKLLGGV